MKADTILYHKINHIFKQYSTAEVKKLVDTYFFLIKMAAEMNACLTF